MGYRKKKNIESGNEEFKGASMQPDSSNNQNVEMNERNEENGQPQETGNGIDKLDLYHVELSGMCTDKDQSDYTKMLAEFALKFSSYVELQPTSLKAINAPVE